ncbi:CapA family protein [Salisediminibacterium beveridgei]|uniref:Poly-gamma-glutamate synthase subunit PgsA/CapA n=1 Tax=Salisediminibacterium beveridgei TaxID=632773 RepID=A0A1D7QRI7_9BACI|nr:CapA family protein [Salisediminibacterium beveridgei]AOM81623.1 Poly-gamma-glutamate synthase subunit PgsA/CapA [Salisediminibacterium beveridgei]
MVDQLRANKPKPRKLTWQEHFLRIMKKHKRQLPVHTSILAAVTGGFLVASTLYTPAEVPDVERSDNNALTASFVGDVMLGRHVQDAVDQKGYDHLFEYTDPFFAASDYATGNFAHPVIPADSDLSPNLDLSVNLRAEPESLDVLAERNFKVMNIANNNIFDYDYLGMTQTRDRFDDHPAIDATGIQTSVPNTGPVTFDHIRYTELEGSGLTVATIGMSDVIAFDAGVRSNRPGVATFDVFAHVMRAIIEASSQSDMVVVHAHWGEYYDSQVTTRQQEIAAAMVHAGADIIVGHNPNVPGPVEIIDDSVVFYSLGNFIFDQGWSRSKQSTLAYYELGENGEASLSLQLFSLRDAQPRPLMNTSLARLQMENTFTKMLEDDQWTKNSDGMITLTLDHRHILGLEEGD